MAYSVAQAAAVQTLTNPIPTTQRIINEVEKGCIFKSSNFLEKITEEEKKKSSYNEDNLFLVIKYSST